MRKYLPIVSAMAFCLSDLSASAVANSQKKPAKQAPEQAVPYGDPAFLRPFQLECDNSVQTALYFLFGSNGPTHTAIAANSTLTTGATTTPNSQSLVNVPVGLSYGIGFQIASTRAGKSGPTYFAQYEAYLPITFNLPSTTALAGNMQSTRAIITSTGDTDVVTSVSGSYQQRYSGRLELLFNRGTFFAEQVSFTPQCGLDFYHTSHVFTSSFTHPGSPASMTEAGTTVLRNKEDAIRIGPLLQGIIRQTLGKSFFLESMFGASGLYNHYSLDTSQKFYADSGSITYAQNMHTSNLNRFTSALYASLGFVYSGVINSTHIELGASYKAMHMPHGTFVSGSNFGSNAMQEQGMTSQFGELRLAATF